MLQSTQPPMIGPTARGDTGPAPQVAKAPAPRPRRTAQRPQTKPWGAGGSSDLLDKRCYLHSLAGMGTAISP